MCRRPVSVTDSIRQRENTRGGGIALDFRCAALESAASFLSCKRIYKSSVNDHGAQTIAGFDRDEGNWPKCGKHGVSQAEIEEVLSREPMVRPDRTGRGEKRFNAIGRDAAGRFVFIAFAIRQVAGRKLLRPISARYMKQKEIAHYEKGKSP
jgi:uncharacterized DUF497 family protein